MILKLNNPQLVTCKKCISCLLPENQLQLHFPFFFGLFLNSSQHVFRSIEIHVSQWIDDFPRCPECHPPPLNYQKYKENTFVQKESFSPHWNLQQPCKTRPRDPRRVGSSRWVSSCHEPHLWGRGSHQPLQLVVLLLLREDHRSPVKLAATGVERLLLEGHLVERSFLAPTGTLVSYHVSA